MFGCVQLKNIFRTRVTRDFSGRFLNITCHASKNVVVSGRFIYLLQDSTLEVDRLSSTSFTLFSLVTIRYLL